MQVRAKKFDRSMFATPFSIDNEEQLQAIDRQISAFRDWNKAFAMIDSLVTSFFLLSIGIYVVNLLPFSTLIAASILLLDFLLVLAIRPDYKENFRNELKLMVDIYDWCAEDVGIKATHSPVITDLVREIKDLVPASYLVRWQATSEKRYSASFRRLLSEAPHEIPEVLLLAPGEEEENKNDEAKPEENSGLLNRFASSFGLGSTSTKPAKKSVDERFKFKSTSETFCGNLSSMRNGLFYAYQPEQPSRGVQNTLSIASKEITKNILQVASTAIDQVVDQGVGRVMRSK